jgi:MinD-like ATPase involved in chromosome partitioning or flagellar assembly
MKIGGLCLLTFVPLLQYYSNKRQVSKVYLVGFYSPKAKSGVTELSLSIYHWLKTNTDLSAAFISYGTLEKEGLSEEVIHEFSKLSLPEQKRIVKNMKKEYDIIIYDASSQLSEGVLKLLPIVDRLFVVGEENTDFAVKLHQIIQFNKTFDKSVKSFIQHLKGNKTFIIRENKEGRVIGFHYTKKETTEIGQMVYRDYVTRYLEEKFIEKNEKIYKKIKQIPKETLFRGLYDLGIDFEKALLFHEYVLLREALGQNFEEALENLFPLLINSSFEEILEKFQNEIKFLAKLKLS